MSLNILINELVGIIPGIGDAFSFWFKSNARNHIDPDARAGVNEAAGALSATLAEPMTHISVVVATRRGVPR